MEKTEEQVKMTDFRRHPVVALDIGGVCISLNHEKIAHVLGVRSFSEVEPGFLKACTLLEQDKISHDAWMDEFCRITGNRFTRGALMELWNTMIGPALPGMTEAVRDLADRGIRFVYLSNTSREHMDIFFSTNAFSHLVTGGIFSYSERIMKPEAAIYQAFEKRYGVPMAYFDDRQENIDGALHLHWNAILFRSPEQFHQETLSALKKLYENTEKSENNRKIF